MKWSQVCVCVGVLVHFIFVSRMEIISFQKLKNTDTHSKGGIISMKQMIYIYLYKFESSFLSSTQSKLLITTLFFSVKCFVEKLIHLIYIYIKLFIPPFSTNDVDENGLNLLVQLLIKLLETMYKGGIICCRCHFVLRQAHQRHIVMGDTHCSNRCNSFRETVFFSPHFFISYLIV